ncbi:MAG: Iron-binding protein IscA [Alphaproteobacteria bacterium MarineAlpha2_Bin1]|nr:MAG: Iron-binding protein IscA [Alphaproteobacteria bacterium MarineAlpha2_Bin1]|tara:strand:+ start:457 stop:807 length:351 start_codon:yes stop_codon:yes gene_type:complete
MDRKLEVLTVTKRAMDRFDNLLSSQGNGSKGFRIGVKQMGCSDMSYTMDFLGEIKSDDIIIESNDIMIVVDLSAKKYIEGTELDWLEKKLESKFVFNNPNVVGQCGCGESFKIKEK